MASLWSFSYEIERYCYAMGRKEKGKVLVQGKACMQAEVRRLQVIDQQGWGSPRVEHAPPEAEVGKVVSGTRDQHRDYCTSHTLRNNVGITDQFSSSSTRLSTEST